MITFMDARFAPPFLVVPILVLVCFTSGVFAQDSQFSKRLHAILVAELPAVNPGGVVDSNR